MKLGVICEGAASDSPSLEILLKAEFPEATIIIRGTSKDVIFKNVGVLVDEMLALGCRKVFILWDLHPIGTQMTVLSQTTETEKLCRWDQRKTLLANAHGTAKACAEDLKELERRHNLRKDRAATNDPRVELVCFSMSFDAIFLADPALLRALASTKTRAADDLQGMDALETMKAPQETLRRYFGRSPNPRLRYFNKLMHNVVLAKAFVDSGKLKSLRRHPGYARLRDKITSCITAATAKPKPKPKG